MAIIYSYPKATNPLATDVLVITDTTVRAGKRSNATKSLSLSDLASYVISSTSAITGGGTFNKIPLWTPDGLKLGDSIVSQSSGGQGVTVTGQLDVTQDFNVTGDAILATAEVTGLTQLNGTLTVEGESIFNDQATFEEEANFQNAVKDQNSNSGVAGQVLSSTGTNVQWVDTVGGSVTGSGTTNFVSKWLDSDTIQDSIIFDSGTKVGIGTATPSGLLEIKGAQPNLFISNTTTATPSNLTFQTINSTGTTYESFGQIRCGEVAGASGSGNRMRLGFVGGTARAISIAPNGPNGESFVGIGTDSPDNNLDVIGGITAQKDGQVFYGKPVTGLATAITEFSNSTGSLEPRIKLVNSTGTTKIVLDGANSPDGGVIFNTTLDVVHDTAIGAAATITNATSVSPTLLLKSSAGGNLIEGGSNASLDAFTVNSQGHIVAPQLKVKQGDIEVEDSASGLILKSPDGTRYRVTVANGGTLTVSAV